MRQKTPIEELFESLQNKENKKMYDAVRPAAEMMFQQKKAFVDSGFTEAQAMELVLNYWITNLRGGN